MVWLLLLGGCATPGPMHVFLAGAGSSPIHDLTVTGAEAPAEILTGFVGLGESVVGVAYDFNTDYVWLRVLPWNQLRVINRPANRMEANYAFGPTLWDLNASLDLATCSSDLHVFAVADSGDRIVELSRRAVRLREITVGAGGRRIGGLAFDQRDDLLLVLWADGSGDVALADRQGKVVGSVRLSGTINPQSLGFDSDQRTFFVPLAENGKMGVFNLNGDLTRVIEVPAGRWAIDAGPRSLVRVF